MCPETKGTSTQLLPWHKSRGDSEPAAGWHRVSLLAPGWKEQGHGWSPHAGRTPPAPRRMLLHDLR